MITDDPGTPGDRKWEINLALAFEHRSDETAYDIPAIDLNYSVGRSEWLYGFVGGFDVAKSTMLMAELHGRSRMNFDREVLTANFGIRQTLSERCIFIGSLGHEVHTPNNDPLAFIGYIGVQLL